MEKATKRQTKDHNNRLILRTIFKSGELSRADLARQTGLTRPTVSTIVADLLADDLVIETGRRPSAGGKPATLIRMKPLGRQLIALDLGGREFRGALVNLDGSVDTLVSHPIDAVRGDEALSEVYRLIERLLPAVNSPLLGIGVGTPGLVNPQDGIVLSAVNLGWSNLPLGNLLATRYNLPTYIANDSHIAALAEYIYGTERDSNNLIVVTIGQGIGAGIVLDGQPFYGDGYGAGEIGHVVIEPEGRLCTCGNRGCLETTSSLPGILRRATEAATQSGDTQLASLHQIDWPTFVAAVADHDPVAVDIAVEAGRHIGAAVAHLVGAFNIHNIVLTGPIADLGEVLLDATVAEMHQRVLPSMAAKTRVEYTTLNQEQRGQNILLGCSALILQKELAIL